MLATHYHPDHIGIVSELMKKGVKLLLLDTQVDYVHFADKIFSKESRLLYTSIHEEEAILISCRQSREFLDQMGISGEIIATPSHSGDSISLVLDDGRCFVGDLEPIHYLAVYEENDPLAKDWQLIMKYNPKKVFYAHVNEQAISSSGCVSI